MITGYGCGCCPLYASTRLHHNDNCAVTLNKTIAALRERIAELEAQIRTKFVSVDVVLEITKTARDLKADRDCALSELAEARKMLKLRTGCNRCKGVGWTLQHQSGHTHYETDSGCPEYHFERVPCDCARAATSPEASQDKEVEHE